MQNDLIQKAATLMTEQTDAYARLESVTTGLCESLTRGEVNEIESFTRAGETELLRMRSRLLEITTVLTGFAELRAGQTEKIPLDAGIRESFEKAAKSLLDAGREFQKTASRASSLSVGGSSFAVACIQMCGIPPTTYRAPVLKYIEGAAAGR